MIILDKSVQNEDRRFYKFYKIKPKCSLAEFIDFLIKPRTYNGVGRAMECEIHIDGDLLFMALGALGAGLAFLTYQAIIAAGRRKRSSDGSYENIQMSSFLKKITPASLQVANFINLGRYISPTMYVACTCTCNIN